MFSDKKIKFVLVEEHPVGCEKDGPGNDPPNSGDILEGADMVADDDVRPLLDKVLIAVDDDFFAEKSKPAQPVYSRFDSLEFLFIPIHRICPDSYFKRIGSKIQKSSVRYAALNMFRQSGAFSPSKNLIFHTNKATV